MLRKIRRAWEHQPHDIRGPSDDWVKRGLVALFDTRNAIEVMAGNRASSVSTSLMASKGGLAADFSGTANQQYAHRAAYAQTGAMTLLILCDIDALSGYGALIAKQATTTTAAPYELRLGVSSTDSRMNLLRASGSSFVQTNASGSSTLSAGAKIARIVVSCAGPGIGPDIAFWINGAKYAIAATDNAGLTTDNGSSSVWIGRRYDGATQLDGRIYHIGLLNLAANDADAAEFTERPFSLFEPRRIWVPVSAGGGSDIDITGIVGNATAAGITGAPAVSIDIAGSVASAVAAGITGSAQVATEIAGAVGNATAAGITGSAQVAVEIAGSVGNAVAEGVAGSTSVTNDINIDGVVGNAVAAGVAGDTSVGSDISISGTVGNAVAAGTTGVPGVSTTIAAAVGNATAAGVSGLAAIGVLIDGSVGNAAAAGITGTLTLDIVVAGVVANAVAAGVTGSASVETAAVSATPGYTIAAKARRLTITAAARRLEIRK